MSSPAAPNVSALAPSEGNAEAVVAVPAAVDPMVTEQHHNNFNLCAFDVATFDEGKDHMQHHNSKMRTSKVPTQSEYKQMVYILTHWDDGNSEHSLDKASFHKKYQSSICKKNPLI